LTTAILTEPHRYRDRVKSVFTSLLQIALSLDESSLFTCSQTASDARDTLPYPELHEESFVDLRFLRACMKLMRVCGLYNNFGWNDLHAPSSKRLRRQLSAAINFIKFREDRLQVYENLHVGREELISGLVEVNEEKVMLQGKLEEANAAAESRWSEADVVENDCEELESEIGKQNKVQAAIRDESTELKKKSSLLKDKIATVELSLQQVEGEERKLQQQVVQDPEKIKGRTEELLKALDAKQAACQASEQDAKISKICVSNVDKAKIDVLIATKTAKEVKEVETELTILQREFDDTNARGAKIEEENAASGSVYEKKKREIHLKDVRTRLDKEQFKIKIDSVDASLSKANAELLLVEKGRRDGKERVEAEQEEVRILKCIIEEERQRSENEIAEMVNKFKDMEKMVMEKNNQFLNALGVH